MFKMYLHYTWLHSTTCKLMSIARFNLQLHYCFIVRKRVKCMHLETLTNKQFELIAKNIYRHLKYLHIFFQQKHSQKETSIISPK